MASRKQPATTAYIPDDILFNNICMRLPAKLLAQMRCVSKPWNAFLSKPSFIKSHLDASVRKNDETLMIFENGFSFHEGKPFIAHNFESSHRQLTDLIKLPANVRNSQDISYNAIIGSIDGLICYASYETEGEAIVHIWNPSLSALLPLPPCLHYSNNVCFRFGFDPKTDDYKVVKLSFYLDYPANPDGVPFIINDMEEVEVYSVKKGCWEIITSRFPSHITDIYDKSEVCVDGLDGHIHWLGSIGEEKNQHVIVTFDLGVETFGEISLPHPIQDGNDNRTFFLGNIAGKLCVMSCVSDGECEVWVMNDESWVKRHIFSHFSGNIDPFGFTLNNEFLFGVGLRLALYDQDAAKVKLFKLQRAPGPTKIVRYVESLVWVKPPK